MTTINSLLRVCSFSVFCFGLSQVMQVIAQPGCAAPFSPGTTPAWVDTYSRQDRYVPGSALNNSVGAVKTIRIAIHVFHRDQGLTALNWRGLNGVAVTPEAHGAALLPTIQNLIALLNDDFHVNVQPPSDPVPGFNYVDSDTKVRFELVGLEIHKNSILWNYPFPQPLARLLRLVTFMQLQQQGCP